MGLSSCLRGIFDRFRMADCVYPDNVIRLSEGIAEGGEISAAIKAKWKAKSDKNVQELWERKERKLTARRAQQQYADGLEPLEAFPDPELVEPVPINEAATSPHELKQIQLDLAQLRKHLGNEWETADEVYKNINYFKDWLPRTQWAYKDRAQTYLLFNTLPTNLKKQLVKVDWTRHCAANDVAKGSLKTMQNWILSWRHMRPRDETALYTLYTGELKQGPKEQLRTWYENMQEVGEDAYGRNKHMWSLPQRRIVARAFIMGCRYHKAHWHLQQDVLEGMDERAIDVHLNHCCNMFEESKGCENQHPYVTSPQGKVGQKGPGAAYKAGGPLHRDKSGPKRKTARNKYSR